MASNAAVVTAIVLAIGAAYFLLFKKSAPSGPALHPTEFRKFPLVGKTQVNHNSAIYRLALPTPEHTLGLPIGQHVSVGAKINGKEVVRSYTPISNNSLKGYVDMLVKTYPTGQISKYFSELEIGDHVLLRGPKGAFDYQPNTFGHLAMVAGGSGLTPMFQLLQAIAENPDDKTKATLIFANVNEVDIFMREELEQFAAAKPDQIKIYYVLNNPPDNWKGYQGFVTAEILTELLPPPSPENKLLLCGPLPMTNAIKKAAVELGWEKPKQPSKMDHQVFLF